jgi:putative aminopeptidase FrvX
MDIVHVSSEGRGDTIVLASVTKDLVANANVVVLHTDEKMLTDKGLKEKLVWLAERNGKNFRCYVFPQDRTPEKFMDWINSDGAEV